jgi:predicted polyphosphate/ATP-dependent NAD kinase
MKKLGLIVNPIAGMGGRVGLKGTDGECVYRQALALGAKPQSHNRAAEALRVIVKTSPQATLLTVPGSMGEDAARQVGMSAILIDEPPSEGLGTTPEDTRRALLEMQKNGVDLLLFAGGDGTARDICDAIAADANPSTEMAILGIPSGVKMHSAVFALTPRRAGEIAAIFLSGGQVAVAEAEVMDIDEDAFRSGSLSATLHGYLNVPRDSGSVQSTKSGVAVADDTTPTDIAHRIITDMADDTLYIIGPGTTTASISDALGIPNTLLGVDVVLNHRLLASDTSENELLSLIHNRPAKIIVSIIGGQGYIFGRGNQQISPSVIRRIGKDNIIVVATRRKLLELDGRPLLVDTGEPSLDMELSGYVKVVTGYRESQVHRISS